MPAHATPAADDLRVRTLPATGGRADAAVILCHGFGAPGTDLVGVGEAVRAQRPDLAERVVFHFPAAPTSLADRGMPGGRAWWWIDLNRLATLAAAGRADEFTREIPPEIDTVRGQLDACLAGLLERDGLPGGRLVLGGFSQGAMLTADYALRSPDPLGGLCLFSGALVADEHWGEWAKNCPTRHVFQSHGRFDTVLPFRSGERLRDLLTDAGHGVDFLAFDGPHTITAGGLAGLVRRIDAVLADVDAPPPVSDGPGGR